MRKSEVRSEGGKQREMERWGAEARRGINR